MKLCHIVASLQREHGGPSRSVRALCGALANTGEQVELLTTHPAGTAAGATATEASGLSIRTFHRDWPQRLCPSRGLRQALRGATPEVIHHHGLWLRTLHYASQVQAPLVISPRGMMSRWAWNHHRVQKALANRFLHPHAFGRIAGWHATSAEEADDIRRLGFGQPICVSPNGVDVPSADEVAAAAAYWKQTCGAEDQQKVALFYGRLHRKKRVLELIELWGRLAPAGWMLLIVGIPEEYTIASLSAEATQFAPATTIQVHDGTAAPAPYAIADLFLLPSHNENFGLTVAEALVHGLPAVVTDTTPWTGLNARNAGWCVPWDQFAAATDAALRSPEPEQRARGERGRQWVTTEFSWRAAAAGLIDFYRKLRSPA